MKESNHTVRITGGKYRGRAIRTPGGNTHPMGERERLALFNMVMGALPEAQVLDAYAGSGALGIEALSRGAAGVEFIEKAPEACQVIRDNLRELGAEGKVVHGAVENMGKMGSTGSMESMELEGKFDLILADPPYDKFEAGKVGRLVEWLKDDGMLVLSHPSEAPELPGVELVRSRQYAGAHISIYAKGAESA